MRAAARGLLMVGVACLGLTILGMIWAFQSAGTGPTPSASQLASNISFALTFSLIGVPCLLGGTFLWIVSCFAPRKPDESPTARA